MFGRRADGRALRKIDPIVALTPYLMPMRCDAQVFMNFKFDYEKMARYIVEKGGEGVKITFLEMLIAAFVRGVAEYPEINRFIVNKRMYARNQLAVSFVTLRDTGDSDKIEENTVKCLFDPRDTIFDVAKRVEAIIDEGRHSEDGDTLAVARLLMNPILANTVVSLARFLDRYGIMPKMLLHASPFHTSVFITHMASIGMPAVNHHIYNFGTTTMFFSIGSIERTVSFDKEGKVVRKRMLPIGVTADERICAGATYAKFVARVMEYMNNPSLLETPPQKVNFEEDRAYGLPAPKKRLKHEKKNLTAAG